MQTSHRALLAAALLLVDTAVVFIPLSSILLAYVLLVRPAWFLKLVVGLYEDAA